MNVRVSVDLIKLYDKVLNDVWDVQCFAWISVASSSSLGRYLVDFAVDALERSNRGSRALVNGCANALDGAVR